MAGLEPLLISVPVQNPGDRVGSPVEIDLTEDDSPENSPSTRKLPQTESSVDHEDRSLANDTAVEASAAKTGPSPSPSFLATSQYGRGDERPPSQIDRWLIQEYCAQSQKVNT